MYKMKAITHHAYFPISVSDELLRVALIQSRKQKTGLGNSHPELIS
jgi:hypothetical protein